MTARKPNHKRFLLDLLLFNPIKHRHEIRRIVNDGKVNPTVVMEKPLVEQLFLGLKDVGLTVREHLIYDEDDKLVITAKPLLAAKEGGATSYQVTYHRYNENIAAGRTHKHGPYFYTVV